MNSNPRFGSFGNTTARIVCAYCRKLSREATPIGKPFLEPGTYLARKTAENDLLKAAAASSRSRSCLRTAASLGLPMRGRS